MVNIGMFKVDHTQLITQIQEKCKMVLSEIYSYIAEYTKNQFKELIENLVEIEGILESVKEVSSKSDGYAMEVEESLRKVEKYIEEQ